MSIGVLVLAFAAGVLSILSPCVLPIAPIVLGTAASEHRWAPAALAGGLALSFVAVGLFAASIGYSIGLDADVFRLVAAALLLVFGAVLMLPRLQARFAVASGPIAAWSDRYFGARQGKGVSGQFLLGMVLGAVWSPCVGPTLGAASLLAAQGRHFPQVALTMLAFGIGAALPLLLFGLVSRQAVAHWRSRLLAAGQFTRTGLGALLMAVAALVLSGYDRSLETVLANASPQWLTALTTRF